MVARITLAKETDMSDQQQSEKEEKQEKHEEKEEKERGEKWRNDPLSSVIWAAILIWAGLVFLADNMGLLGSIERLGPWSLVFIGAGVIVLAEAAIRWWVPQYRRPVGGTLIFGAILIAVGLGNAVSWAVIGPIALIAIGVAILLGGFLRRK
jgi:sorbitol-specific phosphotransferase system component IIBC